MFRLTGALHFENSVISRLTLVWRTVTATAAWCVRWKCLALHVNFSVECLHVVSLFAQIVFGSFRCLLSSHFGMLYLSLIAACNKGYCYNWESSAALLEGGSYKSISWTIPIWLRAASSIWLDTSVVSCSSVRFAFLFKGRRRIFTNSARRYFLFHKVRTTFEAALSSSWREGSELSCCT